MGIYISMCILLQGFCVYILSHEIGKSNENIRDLEVRVANLELGEGKK